MERNIVLIRSVNSGVWIGVMVDRNRDEVVLTEAHKIWRWRGANTTSELALHGPKKGYSRVAEPVNATIVGVCEVIASNERALANASECGWGE